MSDAENEKNIIFVERADHRSPSVMALIAALDGELTGRYGLAETQKIVTLDFAEPGSAFFVAKIEGREVGCGGLRPLEPGVGEIKRMFVVRDARGAGVAKAILAEIEVEARRVGYKVLRLETGARQPEALALYEGAGFHPIPCYGRFADDPLSLCFEKRLDSPP